MNLLLSIRKTLKARANKKFANDQEKYFIGTIKAYGTGVPYARKVAKKFLPQARQMEFKAILGLSESLLKDSWFEEGIVAFELLGKFKKNLNVSVLAIFEKWLDQYISNWAHCDELSAHLIGYIIEEDPSAAKKLIKWTVSKNKWKRRASAVSFIIPAKKGKNLPELLAIAEKLKKDQDDMVQKGVGWMLKEASKAHPEKIIAFIRKNKSVMPRTMLRYSLEKLPQKTKTELMGK
jgi:3-methyladenine DNA glycosylase AlkD